MKHNSFRDLTYQEKKLLELIDKFLPKDSLKIKQAFELAKNAHDSQRRDEGDLYIIHPIRIANMLIDDLKIYNADTIITALLHDVIEDTNISIDIIFKQFGMQVGNLVSFLTRNKAQESKEEKFEKTLKASMDIKILKCCDWLDNLRSFPFRKDREERWFRHLKEAKEMYIPLANSTNNSWLIIEMKKAYGKAVFQE